MKTKIALLLLGIAILAGVAYPKGKSFFSKMGQGGIVTTVSVTGAGPTTGGSSGNNTWTLDDVTDYHSVVGKIKIGASTTTTTGIGLSDTGYIILRTTTEDGTLLKLDSQKFNAVPCSSMIAIPASDTMLKQFLQIKVIVADTSDPVNTWTYPVTWSLFVRE